MRPNVAAVNLGLKLEGLTADEVRAKFRERLRAVHPDTAGGGTAIEGALIKAIQESRDVLLKYVADQNKLTRCNTCKGTGKQKTRRGALIKCSTCGGEGLYIKREFDRG